VPLVQAPPVFSGDLVPGHFFVGLGIGVCGCLFRFDGGPTLVIPLDEDAPNADCGLLSVSESDMYTGDTERDEVPESDECFLRYGRFVGRTSSSLSSRSGLRLLLDLVPSRLSPGFICRSISCFKPGQSCSANRAPLTPAGSTRYNNGVCVSTSRMVSMS